jgi:hypothetical protein
VSGLARKGGANRMRGGRLSRFATSGTLALALAGTMLLSGCAPTDPSDAATERLDASVVQTADRAASGDYAGAAASLDVLQTRLAEYVEAGDVTADRSVEIQAAIDTVRADLTALIAAQSTPTPEPTESGTGVTDQTQAPAPEPAPVETVPGVNETPQDDDGATDQGDDDGPGNDKPGKGNTQPGSGAPGNGKGNKD